MYAMVATRSDLTFAVGVIIGFMHWMGVERIMQYLKDILDMR